MNRLPLVFTALALAGFAAVRPAAAEDPAAGCAAHLQAIHRALAAYRRDHRQLPPRLSDLHPTYLTDAAVFHCPADPTAGETGPIPEQRYGARAPRDRALPLSYSYEFSSEESWGVLSPLGPFPKSDLPGSGWGSWRLVNTHQRTFYGDRVPVVRCYHHPDPSRAGEEVALNLTLEGKIYRSAVDWQREPETVATVLDRFARDYDASPARAQRRWTVGALGSCYHAGDEQAPEPLRRSLLQVAGRLERLAATQRDRQKAVTLEVAGEFLLGAGEYRRVIPVEQARLRALASWRGVQGTFRRESASHRLADAYRGLGEHEKVVRIYERLVADAATRSPYAKARMADAYDAVGQHEKASEWRLKADPDRAMIGTPAPEVTFRLLAGEPVSLAAALQGKKALLVNFWFYG